MSTYIQKSLFLTSCLLVLAMQIGCKHDPFKPNTPGDPNDPNNPNNPTPSTACSPDSVYFQNHVLPILVSNCTQSGCHNAQDKKDGVILTSYTTMVNTVKKATVNNMQDNKMMKVILSSNPDKRMPPPPLPPLTTQQIDVLKKWLAQGGLNNACDENAGGCDLQTAKFASFVQPLIQAKCQGCHNNASPQGNVKLTNYAEIKTVALNGKLYSSITRSSNWMPLGTSKLDNCSIERIQQWITDGAPQN